MFSVCSPGAELSQGGLVATAVANRRMAALGPRTPRFVSGEIVFTFVVRASRDNLGANMALGMAAVSPESEIEEGRGAPAWGYNPFSGRLCIFADSVRSPFMESGEEDGKVISESLRGCTVDAQVTVRADMLHGKLAFSVNGAAFVDSGVELPTTVRPWAKLQLKGDAVEISDSLGPLRAHFEPFARFSESSPGMAVALDGRKAIAVAGSCAAVGPATVASGEHVFHFVVRASTDNLGGYIAVGVADGTSDSQLSRGEGVAAWGFSPYAGHLCVFADSLLTAVDVARSRGAGGGQPLGKSLRGRVVGAKISVLADTERRRLAFSVDDGPFVNAGVVLPVASVRPWVRLGLPGDCVEFMDCSLPEQLHLGLSTIASALGQPSVEDQTQSWLSARWLQCTQSMEISADGRVCRAKAQRHCAVIGPATPSHGVFFFTFTVLKSQFGLGNGIGIGICEWNEEHLEHAGDDVRRGGRGFGFVPSSGRLGIFTDLIETPVSSALRAAPGGRSLSGSLRGHAPGTVVTARADMTRRALAFSINGKKFVEVDVKLPKSVRPWVQLCHDGDEVEFTKSARQETCQLAERRRSSVLGSDVLDMDAIPPDCSASLEAPWEVISGDWHMCAAWSGPHCARQCSTDLSLVVWGEREARDYTFQATVTVVRGARCGLAFRVRGGDAYYVLCLDREAGCAELWEQAPSKPALARRRTFGDALGSERSCTLRVAVSGSECSLFMNAKLQATETVEHLAGQVGLWAWGAEALFADVSWTSSPIDDPFHSIMAKPVWPKVLSEAVVRVREVPPPDRACCFEGGW